MASPNIEAEHVQPNQDQPEVPANNASDRLDNSVNSPGTFSVAPGGTISLATGDTYDNGRIEFTVGGGGATTVQMPNTNPRRMLFKNTSGETVTLENSTSTAANPVTIGDGVEVDVFYTGTDFETAFSGGAGGGRTVATVQTTDATVTTLAAIPIASGSSICLRAFGVAQGPSDATVGFNMTGAGHNAAGTSVLDGRIIDTMDDNANGYTLDIDVDDGADEIRIRVTGIAATTIDWRVEYEFTEEA